MRKRMRGKRGRDDTEREWNPPHDLESRSRRVELYHEARKFLGDGHLIQALANRVAEADVLIEDLSIEIRNPLA